MTIFQGRVSKHVSLISSAAFCLGLLITTSPLEAQSSKASTSAETKHPVLDSSFDPLQAAQPVPHRALGFDSPIQKK